MTFKMLTWWPSWISERNDFSNYKSSCGTASHQVWAQSDLGFGSRCGFKLMAAQVAIWIAKWNDLSNSESLCCSDASHQVLAQSKLRFGRRCRLKNLKMDIGLNNFRNSESLCRSDASYQVLFQSYLRFGRKCRLKISRRPSCTSEWNDFSNSESL